MDASFTFLPLSARDYLHWLKEAHHSYDDWPRFERAVDAWNVYTDARAAANLCKANRAPPAAGPLASSAGSTRERRELFLALAKQIVAQEELRIAVANCRNPVDEAIPSSDGEHFLAWLQARLGEAESEVRMDNLLALPDSPEHCES